MAIRLADVFINLSARDNDLNRELNRAQAKIGLFGNVVQGIAQGIGQALFRATAQGFSGLVGQIGQSITAAADLGESINKTGVIFGQAAQGVLDWSETTANALGISQQAALEAAATFGGLFAAVGVNRGEAAELSKQLVQLAADLASLNNVDPGVALEKLRAGLSGESEPLKALNIFLNETAVNAKAVELGIAAAGEQLNEQQKVMARFAIITEQGSVALGDFERTAGSLPNAMRRLSASFENLQATFGAAFEPLAAAIIDGLANLANQVAPYAENIAAQIASGLAAGLRFITPVLQTLRSIFVFWLQPGSPPRLLPELVRWGQAAAQEYLSGWTKANFSAFNRLGDSIERILRSFVDTGQIQEIDIVGRVFGTRDAIARAISEFRDLGRVSQDTLNDIAAAAGPAGGEVSTVVQAYFDLEQAARDTAAAQEELNAVNERFSEIIDPLQGQLDALRDRERALRDQQQIERINEGLRDPNTTAHERELLNLQKQQILVRAQLADAERERAAAVADAEDGLQQAQEAEAAAADQLSVAESALDARVKQNNLIGEQIRLQERLAEAAQRAAEAANAKALREAEQAQRELEAAMKAAEREAQLLADAQLRYQLQLADTPGKIEIMRAELAKAEEGSVEYFNILTQIASLEQQLAREREAAAKKGGASQLLPDIAPVEPFTPEALFGPELTSAISEFQATIDEIKKGFESEPGEPPKFIVTLKTVVDEVGEAIRKFVDEQLPKLKEGGSALIELLGNIVTGVGEMNTAFRESTSAQDFLELVLELVRLLVFLNEQWGGSEDEREQHTRTFWERIGTIFGETITIITNIFTAFLALLSGSWEAAWKNLKEAFDAGWGKILKRVGEVIPQFVKDIGQGLLDIIEDFREFVEDIGTKIGELATDLYEGGKDLINNLWDGMKEAWKPVGEWLTKRLQDIKNLLPGSEPKDPSSPLRGLSKAGEAIIGNIQSGIERASLNVNTLGAGVQGAAATVSGDTFYINVTTGANTDIAGIRSAAEQGVNAAKRARGG